MPNQQILSCHVCLITTIPQVSSSCTSVYIDGSETRGALNAEVKIKYGTFSGQVESSHASCIVLLANISQMQIVPFTSLQQQCAKCVRSFCHLNISQLKSSYIQLQAFFVIWMPESPLTLRLPDSKLSPIKSWRVAASAEK